MWLLLVECGDDTAAVTVTVLGHFSNFGLIFNAVSLDDVLLVVASVVEIDVEGEVLFSEQKVVVAAKSPVFGDFMGGIEDEATALGVELVEFSPSCKSTVG